MLFISLEFLRVLEKVPSKSESKSQRKQKEEKKNEKLMSRIVWDLYTRKIAIDQ